MNSRCYKPPQDCSTTSTWTGGAFRAVACDACLREDEAEDTWTLKVVRNLEIKNGRNAWYKNGTKCNTQYNNLTMSITTYIVIVIWITNLLFLFLNACRKNKNKNKTWIEKLVKMYKRKLNHLDWMNVENHLHLMEYKKHLDWMK